MGNLGNTIKKFLGNKNTVTILGVIAGVIVLWAFYSYRVKQATSPTKVPYAKVALEATSEITAEDVGMVEVSTKFLKTASVHRSSNEVIGKYVATGTSIPVGGLFYTAQVVNKSEIPNTIFETIKEGYTIFSLKVDNHTTFGNSIYPGDRLDLYMKTTDDDGKIMFGKFINNIEVLAVRDSNGKNVFESTNTRTPAELLFAVEDELFELLKKSEYINGVSLVVVPRNQQYVQTGEPATQAYLKEFILAKTSEIPESFIEDDPEDTPTKPDDNNNKKNNN